MLYEFVVQNELKIQHLGNTSMDNNERYVQYATWSASNTMWVVDIGWRGINAGLVQYVHCYSSTNKFISIEFIFHISLKVVELASDLNLLH